MTSFYKFFQEGADKARALNEAMTQLQGQVRWQHPHYWGAFVLLGDWQ